MQILLILAQFLGAAIALFTALLAWQRRDQPGSYPLTILMLTVAFGGLIAGVKDVLAGETVPTLNSIESLAAGTMVSIYLVYVVEFVRQKKFSTRWLLSLLAGTMSGLVLTAFIRQAHHISPSGQVPPHILDLFFEDPKVLLGLQVYYYLAQTLATFILARHTQKYKVSNAQILPLIYGMVAPWLGILIMSLTDSRVFRHQYSYLDLQPLAYSLSGLALGWGILRYRLLEIVPLARELAFENLRQGILTLDMHDQILDINSTAQSLLEIQPSNAFGQPATNVLANYPALLDLLTTSTPHSIHIASAEETSYSAEITPILDRQGVQRGRMIVLNDITAQQRIADDLFESQSTLQNLLETLPFSLVISTLPEGRIIYTNPVARESYEVEEATLGTLRTSSFYKDPQARAALLEKLMNNTAVTNQELHMQTARGNSRWIMASFRKLKYYGKPALLSAHVDINERKKMEEEIRQGRAQLKLVFDYAGLGIWVSDSQGRYQMVNEYWAAMLGQTPEELIGSEEASYLHPNDIYLNRSQQRALIAGEISNYHIENRYFSANGSTFWGELNVSATRKDTGEVDSIIGFVIDISRRKQAEQALLEKERQLRDILENIQMLAVMLDMDGNITFFNNHIQTVTGWRRAEVLGQNWFNWTLDQDEKDRQDFLRAIRHGTVVSRYESTIQTRSGNQLLISWSNIPLRDENGISIGMASLGEDITQLRRAYESELLQRLLAESLTDASRALASTLNLDEILHRIIENVGKVVPHDRVDIGLLKGQDISFFHSHEYSQDVSDRETLKVHYLNFKRFYALRQLFETKKTVIIPDTHNEPKWIVTPETARVKSYLGAPILVKNKVVGFISIGSEQVNYYTQAHAERLQTFSVQAAVAIENARLFESARHELEERRQAQASLRRANKRLQTQLEEIAQLQDELREQAIRDPLTGLYNRRFLEETLGREVARAERDGMPISILMFDIDYFKNINDSYSHDGGDVVLRGLAHILLKESRRSDIACRYGGEEFCMILPGTPSSIASQRAEDWRKAFENHSFTYKNHTMRATVSIGVAVFPDHGFSGQEVLHSADRALYEAKQTGRNKTSLATSSQ